LGSFIDEAAVTGRNGLNAPQWPCSARRSEEIVAAQIAAAKRATTGADYRSSYRRHETTYTGDAPTHFDGTLIAARASLVDPRLCYAGVQLQAAERPSGLGCADHPASHRDGI
jgi:hypothetical protein